MKLGLSTASAHCPSLRPVPESRKIRARARAVDYIFGSGKNKDFRPMFVIL
eukprot:COSAG02_NODE_29361_length_570_cov_1.987261_1_plen_50_part_01